MQKQIFSQTLLFLRPFHCVCISYLDLSTTSSSAFQVLSTCRLFYPASRFSLLKALLQHRDDVQSKERSLKRERRIQAQARMYYDKEIDNRIIIIAKQLFYIILYNFNIILYNFYENNLFYLKEQITLVMYVINVFIETLK